MLPSCESPGYRLRNGCWNCVHFKYDLPGFDGGDHFACNLDGSYPGEEVESATLKFWGRDHGTCLQAICDAWRVGPNGRDQERACDGGHVFEFHAGSADEKPPVGLHCLCGKTRVGADGELPAGHVLRPWHFVIEEDAGAQG